MPRVRSSWSDRLHRAHPGGRHELEIRLHPRCGLHPAACAPGERLALEGLCANIRAAEERLSAAASARLHRCGTVCRGLCCRNVALEAIIDRTDFVFLLASAPALEPRLAQCLEREEPLFTADCVFLEGGTGPCLFPPHVRPRVCIISFCAGEEALRAEIRQVRGGFEKLGRFIRFRKPARSLRALLGLPQKP